MLRALRSGIEQAEQAARGEARKTLQDRGTVLCTGHSGRACGEEELTGLGWQPSSDVAVVLASRLLWAQGAKHRKGVSRLLSAVQR